MVRNLGVLLLIGLVVYSVIDIARSEPEERLGAPQVLWIALVVLIPLFGSIVWLAVSRSRRTATAAGPRPGPTARRRPPVAPDDDPEFLWRLDQERRRRESGPQPGGTTPDDER